MSLLIGFMPGKMCYLVDSKINAYVWCGGGVKRDSSSYKDSVLMLLCRCLHEWAECGDGWRAQHVVIGKCNP